MAGQKRPQSRIEQSSVEPAAVRPTADANTPEMIPVPAPASAPYSFSNATNSQFETLDLIRVNSLGQSNGEASIFAQIDKSQGYYDLNFKSIAVSGDLVLTETPTSVVLSLKQPEVVPTFIQSGQNLEQTGGRIYKGVNGDVMEFRTIGVGPGLTLQTTGEQVVLGLGFTPAIGDITGATNIGPAGADVFHSKLGNNLQFRKIVSANEVISITPNSADNQIVISFNEYQINLANLTGVLPVTRVSGLSPIATNPDYNFLTNTPAIPVRLSDLQDVTGTPVDGNVLRYVSGTGWTPGTSTAQNAFTQIKVGSNSIMANGPASDFTLAVDQTLELEANTVSRTITVNSKKTGITPGAYTNTNLVVDEYGRITGIQNGSAGGAGLVDPMTTFGDMIYRNSANITTRLKAGSNGQYLVIDNGLPVWKTVTSSGGSVTSVGISGRNGVEATGGPITGAGSFTVGLTTTGVTAGQYTAATVRVDAYGRITQIQNNTIVSGTRKINTSYGLTGGGDLSADLTLGLQKTGITAGTYTNPRIDVDEYGRITNVSNGTGGGGGAGTVTSVAVSGSGGISVTGSPITTSGTIAVTLTNTGVTAGTYSNPTIQVNAQGRITQISAGGGGSDIVLSGELTAGDTGEPIADSWGGIYFAPVFETQLQSASNPVNVNKKTGMFVLNATKGWPYVALEDGPTGAWAPLGTGFPNGPTNPPVILPFVSSAGMTIITPA